MCVCVCVCVCVYVCISKAGEDTQRDVLHGSQVIVTIITNRHVNLTALLSLYMFLCLSSPPFFLYHSLYHALKTTTLPLSLIPLVIFFLLLLLLLLHLLLLHRFPFLPPFLLHLFRISVPLLPTLPHPLTWPPSQLVAVKQERQLVEGVRVRRL